MVWVENFKILQKYVKILSIIWEWITWRIGDDIIKIWCPFCYSSDTLAIVCNDKIPPKQSKYYSEICNQKRLERNEAILSNFNLHYSQEYNGKVVKRRTYDRFCNNCGRPFYYVSNMIVSDIKILTFVIETSSDKWKYEIYFDRNNSYYNIDHNYITKSYKASLTPARRLKILEGIDKSKMLKWKAIKEGNKFDYNIRWNIYLEFYDGQTYNRGGYDEYPKNWSIFIDLFGRVFKNEIFKKMK